MIRILYTAGWIMCLLGGLILIILGILGVLNIFLFIFYPFFALSTLFWGIIIGIIGLMCVGGARFVHRLGTAILLLLLGIGASLLGAWFTAWLVIVGAIFGLLSRL